MPRPKVVIVGAGPGGLSAALTLCQDFDVTVVEKNDWPGGRMGRVEREGYAFDTGPSILQYPAALDSVFAAAGLEREDYVDLLEVEPYTYLKFWDDSELYCYSQLDKMRESVERLSPGLGVRFERWATEHAAKFDVAYDAFIASPGSSVLRYLNPVKTLPAAKYKPWETLYKCLMGYFDDERMTYAFSYPSKYLGLHPTNCSSVFSVISYLEYGFGVWHPRGGFRALADGMKRAAEDKGVTFMMGTEVAEIVTRGAGDGRPTAEGVRLRDGTTVWANHVVANADFAYANQELIDPRARSKYTDAKLHRMKYSCSTYMLYLGLDTKYDLPHHSIYLSEHTRNTDPASLEDAYIDTLDPPIYACNPCATEGSSAPEGHSTLYVLVPCPNTFHAVDWEKEQPRLRAAAMRQLVKLGFDDLEEHITFERAFNAQTWQNEFNVFKGAVFNLAHTLTQIGPLRPHCESEDVDGLYWVGGGTHPGSGLVTIFESSKIAAKAAAEAAAAGQAAQ